MNTQLLNDFVTRIRVNVESLSLEISRNNIDTKETFNKIKQTKNDLTHLYNLIKIEENIQETQKNVTQLNIEYMDVSTKLTLLQNHQLLIEMESDKIHIIT